MEIHVNQQAETEKIPEEEGQNTDLPMEPEPESLIDAPTTEDEGAVSQETVDDLVSQKQRLVDEIAMLESELESKRAETDRKIKEYAEFRELFPRVDPAELDPQVLESVENGVPLCAAYALYEKRMAAKNAAAMAHNKATKRDGFGSVGRGSEGDFYSPDEVRAMTQSEVKQNYQKILRSMKNWH